MSNLVFPGDDVVWTSWRFLAAEEIQNLRHQNEVIGAYVTAGLEERDIYCDTDNVVYVLRREGPALVETGDNLGAMTSELKPSEFIKEFVSGGPKKLCLQDS